MNRNQSKLIILGLFFLVACGMSAVALRPAPAADIPQPLVSARESAPRPDTATPPPSAAPQLYRLALQEGFVAVFPENGDPIRTEIRASTLRQTDRELFEAGVLVRGEAELATFLENFLG